MGLTREFGYNVGLTIFDSTDFELGVRIRRDNDDDDDDDAKSRFNCWSFNCR